MAADIAESHKSGENFGFSRLSFTCVTFATIVLFTLCAILIIKEISNQHKNTLQNQKQNYRALVQLESQLYKIEEQIDSRNKKARALAEDSLSQQFNIVVGRHSDTEKPKTLEMLHREINDILQTSEPEESTNLRQHIFSMDKRILLLITALCASGFGLVIFWTHQIVISVRFARQAQNARQAMEAMKARLQNAIEIIDDGFLLLDPDENIILANWRFKKFYPDIAAQCIPGTHYPELLKKFEQLPDFNTNMAFEKTLADGRILLIRSHKTENGEFVSTQTDITDIRKAEALLAERLMAMEAANDGIGIIDKNKNLVYMNAALAGLHAIEDIETVMHKPVGLLYNEKGRAQLEKYVYPVVYRDGHWQGESRILRKNGDIIDTELSLTLLSNGGMIGTARDITARKKADAEQESLREQLFQSQKMEAIGRFAGGIAHDFNNILASILGYAEFLVDDLDPSTEHNRYAQQILKSGSKARALVDQIMAFSRKEKPEHTHIDGVEILHEIETLLEPVLPANVALQYTTELTAAPLLANGSQIHQVLMNLCVNAIDAMSQPEGLIKIGLVKKPAGTCWAAAEADQIHIEAVDDQTVRGSFGNPVSDTEMFCFSIADNGHGMTLETMEKIFEPFFTTKEKGKGTGLGLAAVHGIITTHKGALIVESRLNQGTRFEVYLPVVAAKDTPQSYDENRIECGSETILIVDDEESVGDMLTLALQRQGYDPIYCTSGAEALALLRADPEICDLVISDYNMPGMKGLALAQAIEKEFPDLPVIIVSGYSGLNREQIKSCQSVRAVLKKPIDSHALAQNLREILNN